MNYTQTRKFISSLRRLQKTLDLNNTLFAEFLGVGRSTLGGWYSGVSKPEPETIEAIFNRAAEKRDAFSRHADAMLDFIAVNIPIN